MRLLSWNVNGLRAVAKKGFLEWLCSESPDVLALQEIKARTQDIPQELHNPCGYTGYFLPAERRGYSGVGMYTKIKPKKVEGLGAPEYDQEGRAQIAYFDHFVFFNAYFPMTGRDERLSYKLGFNDALLARMEKERKNGRSVVLCGDLNAAHEEIDLARPKENDGRAGFRPEERAWVDELVAHGYVDTFRYFYPERADAYTYWDLKTRARDRNVGWRIDYFFISSDLLPALRSAFILDYVLGSDHAPVGIELNLS